MSAFRPKVVLLPLLVLAACSDDPLDPCADIGCGVEGVDLAIVDFRIDYRADQEFDERINARVVEPGDEIDFRYRIVNRGTDRSSATRLHMGTAVPQGNLGGIDGRYVAVVDVPALDPREAFDGVATALAPSGHLRTDEIVATATLGEEFYDFYFDAEPANGTAETAYRIAEPVLDLALDAGDDAVRTGEADTVWVTLRNVSPVAALDGGDYEIGLCALVVMDGAPDGGCGNGFFAVQPVPSVAAGHSGGVEMAFVLPPDAFPFDWTTDGLQACVGPAGAGDEEERFERLATGACADVRVALEPDLDAACSPPAVNVPATLDASEAESDCDVFDWFEYDVWAFEADAAGLHSFTPVAGTLDDVTVFGPDRERIDISSEGAFFAPEAGRYHVVVNSKTALPIYTLE